MSLTPQQQDIGYSGKEMTLQARLRALVDLFASAQVPVAVSPDVMGELWRKLMLNCAYNAISAIAQQPYGRMAALPEIRALQRAVVHEVVAVARAAGRPMHPHPGAAARDCSLWADAVARCGSALRSGRNCRAATRRPA